MTYNEYFSIVYIYWYDMIPIYAPVYSTLYIDIISNLVDMICF